MSIIKKLEAEINVLQDKIKNIQDQCSHPESCLDKTHGSNTGNYDPHDDCYWTDYHCHLCDRKWTAYKE